MANGMEHRYDPDLWEVFKAAHRIRYVLIGMQDDSHDVRQLKHINYKLLTEIEDMLFCSILEPVK